jgi:hypothetical protein
MTPIIDWPFPWSIIGLIAFVVIGAWVQAKFSSH